MVHPQEVSTRRQHDKDDLIWARLPVLPGRPRRDLVWVAGEVGRGVSLAADQAIRFCCLEVTWAGPP